MLENFSTANNPLITDKDIGHLLPLRCGHRGKPSRNEERLLENLLRESEFLIHTNLLDNSEMAPEIG